LAQVTVKINGYTYTVGCEDGQEQHLLAMAAEIDGRIESIKALGGGSGESRMLVMSALLMADELHDMRIELDALRASATKGGGKAKGDPDVNRRISKLAMRAEQIAAELERP
jgi:cell division protein ZapA